MFDTRFAKAWRELTARKARTFFTWCGLVAGLLGFGTVIVAYFWLSNDLTRNFLKTNPANITVETQTLDEDRLDALKALEGVAAVENRLQYRGQMEIRPERWIQLVLFVVEDFENLRVAKIEGEAGVWPPPKGSLLLERSGKVFFRDRLQITPADDGHPDKMKVIPTRISMFGDQPLDTQIVGLAFDAGMAPSPMEHMLYGYVTMETFQAWFPHESEARYTITIAENPQDTSAAWQVAWRIDDFFEDAGLPKPSMIVPDAGKHPHQFQLNAILILFAGLAFLAFLLCAVLVVNLINAILAKQLRQIGILKAVGGSRRQVMAVYLGSMVLLGIATSAVAVPMAARMGQGLARGVSRMLNFELLTETLPWWFLPALAALGILLPVLVAWWPVSRAVGSSVRETLRMEGRGAQKTATLFQNGWPGPLSLGLAIRNNLRRPLRFALTVVTLTVGLTFFMAALNVQSSLMQTAKTVEETKKHDLRVRLRAPHPIAEIRKWGEDFPNVERMEYWMHDGVSVEMEAGRFGNPLALILVPEHQQALAPKIIAGHWLDPEFPNGIVVNQKFMNGYPEVRVGGEYNFKIRDTVFSLRIVGVAKEFRGAGVYLSKATYHEYFGYSDMATMVLMTLDDHSFSAQAEMRRTLQKQASQFDGKLGHIDLNPAGGPHREAAPGYHRLCIGVSSPW